MVSYKDFEKTYIGSSDIAALVVVGPTEDGLKAEILRFGEDGDYSAYMVLQEAEIGEHYSKVFSFSNWVKIYDDNELVCKISGDKINIYRSGMFGCIIQMIN